jgi:predicted metal-dependent phosphoesterase TrpH
MPRRSPFTNLARQLAALARPQRADLHVHTTASDGEFTPSQVVAHARQAGVAAVAVTDHDTLAGVAEARAAAPELEVIAGVEISTSFNGREFHLLGYFVRTDHAELNAALARVCERRRERFREFVERLRAAGRDIPADRVALVEQGAVSLGRRHVAQLLVACGAARHRNEAFQRFVGPVRTGVGPKVLVPVEEAIRLVHAAGGVASLAHPPTDLGDEAFRTLAGYGLDALEAEYPWGRNSRSNALREAAARFGLAVSGGSDCHGPDPQHRMVGTHGVTVEELAALRARIAGHPRSP